MSFLLPIINRFGHTMIPPGIYLRDGKCNFQKNNSESNALRLCSSWWDAQVGKTWLKVDDKIIYDIIS